MNNATEPVAYPIPAACARMGVSRSLLYRLIADGEIEARKARGRTLITSTEILRWVGSLPTVGGA